MGRIVLNHKESTFMNEGPGAYLLPEIDTHLRRGEIAEAWAVDKETRAAAKAYSVKRYSGVPCQSESQHGRLRHTANGICCECVKERGRARTAKLREQRAEREVQRR
jgi:glucose-6-phosphate dehydrogenase assembly protein OpcA